LGVQVAAGLIVLALLLTVVPQLVRWVRFELALSRRVRRYEEREEAGRVSRVRW
jgi:hypothetical protein